MPTPTEESAAEQIARRLVTERLDAEYDARRRAADCPKHAGLHPLPLASVFWYCFACEQYFVREPPAGRRRDRELERAFASLRAAIAARLEQ